MPRRYRRRLGLAALAAAAALVGAQVAEAGVRSDEFNGPTIDSAIWSFVDPVGDATVEADGSAARIVVPGGVSHDLWVGANLAPRLLQAAPNDDIEVEVKFDSAVAAQYQMQGLVFVERSDRLLRFEVHHDGVATRLFAAALTDGNATVEHYSTVHGVPRYLRVKRAGDAWTLGYSEDGASWGWAPSFSYPLGLTAVGPFAGNSRTPSFTTPQFTAVVDHFRVIGGEPPPPPDTTPPTIGGLTVSSTRHSASVSWQTDEPADSRIDYGRTSAFGSSRTTAELTTNHMLELGGLACETTYHFRVSSRDAAGNVATGDSGSLTTGACRRLTSDEFAGAELDSSVWRFVDPVGDATASLVDGRAVLALPAGSAHDLWTGSLTAPRLLQHARDEDFDVELKFDGTLDSRYQTQGLIVQQDAENLLRFDVHHDGAGLNLFAASVANGQASSRLYQSIGSASAPIYLRVTRLGDSWTLSYSRDRLSWTTGGTFDEPLTVTEVGPFAANTGSPVPAHDVRVDYFRVLSAGTPEPDTTPPTIGAVTVAARATSATVSWATDEPATSVVDYGLTSAYGATETVPGVATAHAVSFDGLSCATTYHVGIRSVDEAGNAAAAPDRTFTTAACPGSPVSDGFDGAEPDWDLWRLVDPVGDATASVGQGRLTLGVPAGVAHDLWTNALTAPRLLQAVTNGDFEIEAKFEGAVSEGFQMQGLVAQQDHDDLVRFDVYSDGSTTRIFAATITNGVATGRLDTRITAGAPLFLRMRRAGDQWTLLYSRAGGVWTQAATFSRSLVVKDVGLFVGNNGLSGATPPAFAASVDYFHNAATAPPPPPDTIPPRISDISVAPGVSTAVVSWITDEASTSAVGFGRSTVSERTTSGNEFGLEHSVTLAGLACETAYHFSVRSADEDGNEAVGTPATFTTQACPAPIESDEFDGPGLDARWRLSDPLGDSTLTPPSGGVVAISVTDTAEHDVWTDTNHAPRLLQATRDEDFEVELRFETPVTQRYQMQGLLVEQDDANLVRVDLHSDASNTYLYAATLSAGKGQTKHSSVVEGGAPAYLRVKRAGATWTLRYSRDGTFWSTPATFSQPLTVTALGPFVGNAGRPSRPAFTGQIDHFRVLSLGTPPPDTKAPLVGNVETTADDESATITWLTDEPASSTLRYGPSASYGTDASANEFETAHRIVLSDLACATTYHFQIVARDEAGNEARTDDATFATAACPPPDVTPPVISSVSVQPSVRSAFVSWTTDERATSRLEFGATPAYGQNVEDGTLTTTHRVSLTDIECDTQYHFRVVSVDRAGNLSASEDGTFRTSVCPPPGGPDIDVWYGDDQVFGLIGTPQNWANIVGHVSDPDGIQRVRYSLNGGPYTTLVIDPDFSVRIAELGDFNIELDFLELVAGTNQVEIVATDKVGYQTTRVVTVRYAGSSSWPLPYTANWGASARVSDAGQVVDGLWAIEGENLRTVKPGYDRVVAIGERSWQNYEVSFPFTLNSLSSTSQHAGFGVAVGWQGHAGTQRPRFEYPFGLLCFYYRNFKTDDYHLWLMGSDDSFIVNDGNANHLALGARYVLKMRNENIGSGMARFSCKVWHSSNPEPAGWNVVAERPARSGSAILVADYADVSVGNVTIRPVSGVVETAPAISEVAATASATSAWIRWRTDRPASTTVHYGTTSAYGTTHADQDLTDRHALTLWGLACDTTYHYKLVSTDAGGRSASSADRVLTTAPCTSDSSMPFEREAVDADAVRPHAKALGDLDGDGLLDAIYGQLEGGPGGLYWYEAPTWTKHAIRPNGAFKEDMQTTDVDGDGDTDIVVGTLDGLRWFVNPSAEGGNPRTQWIQRTINSVYTHDIELGDFDKDGRIDIATEFGIFLQTPTGGWNLLGSASIDRDPAYYGTGVGDVNGDGHLDVVVSGPQWPHPVVWYENPLGSGRPISDAWQRRGVGPGPASEPWKGAFVVADVNHDGRVDIIAAPMWVNHSGLTWYEARIDGSGNLAWTAHVIDNSFTAVHTFEAADANRDGKVDLVLVEQEQSPLDRVSILYGNGGSSWSLSVLARTGGHNSKIGDVDADGDVDVLVANHGFYGAATPLELWRAKPLAGRSAPTESTGDLATEASLDPPTGVLESQVLAATSGAPDGSEHQTNCGP